MTAAAAPPKSLELTAEQQAALGARGHSVALSAGAGCGKTFVLTERFISHLQPEPGDAETVDKLHELIAITFTDRAAREMRDRIRSKCAQRLEQLPANAPAEQIRYWVRLLRKLDTARISTIHSFCGALLRSHAVEAGIDPRFSVVEQAQSDTLLAELIEDVLREKLSQQDEAVIQMSVDFGLERLHAMTASLLSNGGTIDFDGWLARTPTEITAIWQRYHQQHAVPAVLRMLTPSSASRRLLAFLESLPTVPTTFEAQRNLLLMELPALASSKEPRAVLARMHEAARLPKGGKAVWADEKLYEQCRDLSEVFRAELKKRIDSLTFDPQAVEADAAAGLQLLALARVVHDRYAARKKELAWLDFNDLLLGAHRLLTGPASAPLREELSSHVKLLLVDECQDTDPVQVDLITSLCGDFAANGKLFFVGDFKQSIYRFRGADPSVFLALQQQTPKAGRLPLSQNYRSQPAILNFVNALFCDALSGDDRYQPLRHKRPQTTAEPAVEFLWTIVEDLNKRAGGSVEEARKREADLIARHIREMLDQQEPLLAEKAAVAGANGDGERSEIASPVQQKDIAILFRALSDVQHYEEALRKYQIDYYLVGGHAFYAQQEIYDITNLLRTLASPADGISLVGVLRSPMFALSDDTLFWLAQDARGLAHGLFSEPLPAKITGPQRERAAHAAAVLKRLRMQKDRLPIAGLLNEALRLTGYDAVLLGEFMGERKLANLRKLLDQARQFDRSGGLGLDDFIVQLSDFIVEQPREPLAATHPEGTDVVRLMTIHQAKGLEFPVVFLPDINRATHGNDRTAVWDDTLGPLVKLSDRNDKKKHVAGLDLLKTVAEAEEQAERLRLFYVATTRAKDYLVLSSSLFAGEIDSPSAPWTRLLAERFNLQTGEFIATLPAEPNYFLPAVKVTTALPEIKGAADAVNGRRNLETLVDQAVAAAQQGRSAPARGNAVADSQTEKLAGPIGVDRSARRRFSVSRLSGQLEQTGDPFSAENADDQTVQPSGSGAVDLGILVHQLLARADFSRPYDRQAAVKRIVDSQPASIAEHAESATKLAEQFLNSPRGKELAQAKRVERELEFLLAWPPDGALDRTKKTITSEGIYLQGFIDCLYEDAAGRWHLLDYKTNQVAADKVATAAVQYEMQLGVYALAIETILGQPPAELVVNFLRPSREHLFSWNAAMQAKTIDLVNKAIQSLRFPK